MKKILITGGTGYIGSHIAVSLASNGYIPILIDNLSNSHKSTIKALHSIIKKKFFFYKADLNNKLKLESIFNQHSIYGVIHCAALKSVTESLEKPFLYLNYNTKITLNLLECMEKSKVFNIIFSSTAAVYNHRKNNSPLTENCKIGKINDAYGFSKIVGENILTSLAKTDNRWKIIIARYFNVIGNNPTGLISDNPKVKNFNLIPNIVSVYRKKSSFLNIYGNNYDTKDGTCIRDYIHVEDLVNAHIAMLKNSNFKKGVEIYNFGLGKGFTVLEIVKAFQKKTGVLIPYKFTSARKGDAPVIYCNTKKALQKLAWKATSNLNKMVEDIIKSF